MLCDNWCSMIFIIMKYDFLYPLFLIIPESDRLVKKQRLHQYRIKGS